MSQIYKTNGWHQYLWEDYLENNTDAYHMVESGRRKIYSFPNFTQDMFARLYDNVDQVEKTKPEDKWAKNAHEEIEQLPEFKQLAEKCNGDKLLSGQATEQFCNHIYEKLPASNLKDPNDLREQAKDLKRTIEELKKNGKNDLADKTQKKLDQIIHMGKELVNNANQYANNMDESEIRNAIRVAIAKADDSITETNEIIDAFTWGNADGTPTNVPVENKKKILDRIKNSEKLKKLAKEAGRLKNIAARKQRSKADLSKTEVTDIELGNDLARLLPSEMAKLCNDSTRLDFFRRYTERSLLQYKLSGKEKQGQGPIVVCLDQSGSMAGEREVWSKAIVMALIQIAKKQKRAIRIIHFDNTIRRIDDWHKNIDPMIVLDSMSEFFGGGTNFEKPLNEALNAIKENEFKKADVIFITDDACDVNDMFLEEWNKVKKHKKFTCYGIGINTSGHVLKKFSDKTLSVNIHDTELAEDLILEI